ncbi:MAG: hypothetical protein ACYCPH_02475 [Minisyncoccota bacterium]
MMCVIVFRVYHTEYLDGFHYAPAALSISPWGVILLTDGMRNLTS